MLKLFKTAAALAIGAAAITSAHAAPLPGWYGHYVWEEEIGRIGGSTPAEGVTAFITYTLALGPGNGATGCMVHAEGYQTYEQLKCTATPQMDSLIIKYYKFGPNAPGRYAMGAPLFTMTRTPHGLITRLQALRPAVRSTPQTGRLFRRED